MATLSIARPSQSTVQLTRRLLVCGIAAGPIFIGLALVQILTREGFDLRQHAISMLSLGDLGWLQIANFVGTGLLTIACAVGLRRAQLGNWGPILVGVYGAGHVAAGVFTTDPAFNFPPGAPAGMPPSFSWHAILHSLAFIVAFSSLIAACFVLARKLHGAWTGYSVATGLATPVLVAFGMSGTDRAGVAFFVAAIITWIWLAAVAARTAVSAESTA